MKKLPILTLTLAANLAFTPLLPGLLAAPGAHGPNGEHLDAPATGTPASAAPRMEARSEAFELVGVLQGGELSILINRFETNEPVLGAVVELESGERKAKAAFHADHGDYAVADEAFLKALSRPGSHPLVITVTAGAEADLLDGSLHVPQGAHADDHEGWGWPVGIAAALAVAMAGVLGWRGWLRRRADTRLPAPGSAA